MFTSSIQINSLHLKVLVTIIFVFQLARVENFCVYWNSPVRLLFKLKQHVSNLSYIQIKLFFLRSDCSLSQIFTLSGPLPLFVPLRSVSHWRHLTIRDLTMWEAFSSPPLLAYCQRSLSWLKNGYSPQPTLDLQCLDIPCR